MTPDDLMWQLSYGYICYNNSDTATMHEAFHAHLYKNGGRGR